MGATLGVFVLLFSFSLLLGERWVERSHEDFQDGYEWYYSGPGGDSAKLWDDGFLRRWRIGSRLWSPAWGGLRILGQDLDIDDDGWLDLPLATNDAVKERVFFGGPEGFSEDNMVELPTPSYGQGIFLADLDGDGVLELLLANEFYPGIGYKVPSYILTCTEPRNFVVIDTIPFPVSYAAQAIHPADLDGDGYLDLVISSHVDEHNNPDMNSYVLYGPGPFRFASPSDTLPVYGGIWSQLRISMRMAFSTLLSRAIEVPTGDGFHSLRFSGVRRTDIEPTDLWDYL